MFLYRAAREEELANERPGDGLPLPASRVGKDIVFDNPAGLNFLYGSGVALIVAPSLLSRPLSLRFMNVGSVSVIFYS